jgi:myo-inositol-1(or 4)-monophosphatase
MTETDLELILSAARAAGELALKIRARGLELTTKSDGTPVTNADLEVDALLKSLLIGARPDYGWLSEETIDDPARLQRQRLFVVDPIDGTRAFLRDRPWWVVSIAVVEAGRPTAGVAHAPDTGETFQAVTGGGAFRNGAPIAPSGATRLEGCAMLGDAKLFAHPIWSPPWPPMRIESRNSIAYRLCLVACGDFDAAIAMSSKREWDLAAADLIASEAGCLVTTRSGRPLAYNRANATASSLVCASPALHPLILQRTGPIELRRSTEAD